ncbi:hypothetical protein A3C23_05025 [Candidatus Roizmanbacteria bacterium RIFCSPHIGHO2_02_FULL_37_13b]|uniref:DHHA1 domain-containing protein n=1 Tax=Candidatus Roizmanbacteria bacterium RIFCSPLOWO2_02_FULL_36_11 TaxID=1802071 RepID=A0A1F7JIL7_9BACT|nr:MAG: hypothetical protein A3C23_05025 [Candidatus Roizmanbacteria bacterium RIFCSPHIGHO2_02_FULL_37_13b]OGK55458.1 MAG: hypothetical protein A3H78_01210 [Candidatus Roizmanbacteria bacterium RIFCSPLOWO2_02_FULL_36_11]
MTAQIEHREVRPTGYGEIYQIPYQSDMSADDIRRLFPNTNAVIAVDFPISGEGEPLLTPEGDLIGHQFKNGVISVDHHNDDLQMCQPNICTTTLAWQMVEAGMRPNKKTPIVINHHDPDSILSAVLLSGMEGGLVKRDKLVEAALCSDHGVKPSSEKLNKIIELLFALDERDSFADSWVAVESLLRGYRMPDYVDPALRAYRAIKKRAEEAFQRVEEMGRGVHLLYLNEGIPSHHFIEAARRGGAKVLVIISPDPYDEKNLRIRVRGVDLPEFVYLTAMDLGRFGFRGRFDAGSIFANDGIDPDLVMKTIVEHMPT